MALDKIEKLLEKYFEGATTIAEEKELKEYFTGTAVAPQLEHYQPLFAYTVQAKQEQFTPTLTLPKKKRSPAVWIAVAASVVVLLGVSWFTYQHLQPPKATEYGTYEDPEVAFKATQKALAMISEHVNKGIGSMTYLNEYEQSKNKIFKN